MGTKVISKKSTIALALGLVLSATIVTGTSAIYNLKEQITMDRPIVPTFKEVFANDPNRKIEYNPVFPPVGSVYAVNLSGRVHVPTTDLVEHLSVYLELEVTSVKTKGIPGASLKIVSGEVRIGDETHTLAYGTAAHVPVHKININGYTEDGLTILTVSASLARPLSVSISDAVQLIPPDRERTGSFQIVQQYWVLSVFTGEISRIK
jgi:hypothetical protein